MSALLSHAEQLSPAPRASCPLKVISFVVDGRIFGVDVVRVREIRSWQPTTPLPKLARHVLGVINLRGEAVAIFDLRTRLGLEPTANLASCVVIVVDIGERLAGLVADSVSDILDIDPAEYRPAPDSAVENDPTTALILREDALITLLDIDALTLS